MLTSIRILPRLLACAAPLFLTATGFAEDLAARVTSRIRESEELRSTAIEIRTLGPTVWLIGTVNDESQQRSARSLAEATPGVERVIDQIVVAGFPASPAVLEAQAPPTSDVATQVAASLRDSGKLSGYRVGVKADEGTVWLSGTVSNSEQLGAAVTLAEKTPGVERVVSNLAVSEAEKVAPVNKKPSLFSLTDPLRAMVGLGKSEPSVEQAVVTGERGHVVQAAAEADPEKKSDASIQLVQSQQPIPRSRPSTAQRVAAQAARANVPRPLNSAMPSAAALPAHGKQTPKGAVRTAAYGETMMLPGPGGQQDFGPVDGQMVPGSMRVTDGGVPTGGAGPSGFGRPIPMGAAGVGMPQVPVRGGGPNMPNYAWPSYAANPNYAAVQYPTQYSPTAWPYIGPFYPYPQVPLGWRRVSLEWDDGWWFLDFDERHIHSHHR